MSELQTFNNPDFGEIRTLTIDNQPWFVGKDVASALGYADATDALKKHVDDEDKNLLRPGESPGLRINNRGVYIINESGLYSLILSSKLPAAKKFKRWVTGEVLPAIRQTGRYNIVAAPATTRQRVLTTDDYLKAAQIVAACRNERLPYVMHYLEQGGFEAPHFADTESGISDSVRAIRLITVAKLIYGLNNAQIGRIVGLDRVQISRYANGQYGMHTQRAAKVIRQLTDALSQMQGMQ